MEIEEPDDSSESRKRLIPAELLMAIGCVAFGAVVIIGYIAFLNKYSHSQAAGRQANLPKLKATISLRETQITIANNDADDWVNVDIVLNPPNLQGGSLFRGGYLRSVPVIKAHTVFVVNMIEFRTSAGLRFDPEQRQPKTILLQAQVGGQKRYYGAAINSATQNVAPDGPQ